MDINERVTALTNTRAKVWAEAEAWIDKLPAGQEMNAEERQQWERYNQRIDDLRTEAEDLALRHRQAVESEGIREAQAVTFGVDTEERDVRSADAEVRAWLRGHEHRSMVNDEGQVVNGYSSNIMRVQHERELLRSGASPDEIRALAWDTGSSASAVPTLFDRRLYEVMEANIAFLRMPTTKISTDSGASMEFPKVASHAVATQVIGQGTALAGTDPSFAKLTLSPVKFGELIKVSSEVISDAGVDIVGFITRDLGRALSRKVNEAAMTTFNASVFVGAAGTVATGGSLITAGSDYGKLVDLEFSINDAYRSSSSTAWLVKDSTAAIMRKLRDGAGGTIGAPMWQPSLDGGVSGLRTPDRLFGYPVYTDPNMAAAASAAKSVAFGDFSAYYLRTVGSVSIERNDSRFFDTDEVGFRGRHRMASGAQDLTAINWIRQAVA